MARIVIHDDYYTGYEFDEMPSSATQAWGGTVHELPDEIVTLFNRVTEAFNAMQSILKLMDEASRK